MSTSLPCANVKKDFGKHTLVITARQPATGLNTESRLIARTVKFWLYLAGLIEKGERLCNEQLQSVENTNDSGEGYEFSPEPRVTVFNWNHELPGNIGLTVHSDTFPQNALSVWWATYDALQELGALQNTPQSNEKGANSSATPQNQITPKQQQNAVNNPSNAILPVTGKKQAKELASGQQFSMNIVKVAMVMSRTGQQTWELFTNYGGKPGQYAEMTVYADNEIAIRDGIVLKLNKLGLIPGKEKDGQWFIVGRVYESKGKKGLSLVRFEAVEP